MFARLSALVAGLAMIFVLAGCGSDDGTVQAAQAATPSSQFLPQPGPVDEPKTEAAARLAALNSWTAYASGDYAGAYDVFTKDHKALISREDYARVVSTCLPDGPPMLGVKIKSVRAEGDDYVVIIDAGIATTARTYTYEDGHWREKMTATQKKDLANGPDVWLKELQAEGTCDS